MLHARLCASVHTFTSALDSGAFVCSRALLYCIRWHQHFIPVHTFADMLCSTSYVCISTLTLARVCISTLPQIKRFHLVSANLQSDGVFACKMHSCLHSQSPRRHSATRCSCKDCAVTFSLSHQTVPYATPPSLSLLLPLTGTSTVLTCSHLSSSAPSSNHP